MIKFVIAVFLSLFLLPAQVLAAASIPKSFFINQPLWNLICILSGHSISRCDITPSVLISSLLPNVLVLVGVVFFILILGGGFMMIKSAGGDANAQDTAKAKNAVTFALVGFLLVITAYFILQIVGVIIGVNFISPPTL